jgi:hypothetical protein
MTDEELLKAGERLYNSFVQSPFSFLELAGLAAARERRTPWSQLGPRLKFAVFRLVIGPEPEGPAVASGDESPAPAAPAWAPVTSAAPESVSRDPLPASTTVTPATADAVTAPAAVAPAADPMRPSVSPNPADHGEETDDRGDDLV